MFSASSGDKVVVVIFFGSVFSGKVAIMLAVYANTNRVSLRKDMLKYSSYILTSIRNLHVDVYNLHFSQCFALFCNTIILPCYMYCSIERQINIYNIGVFAGTSKKLCQCSKSSKVSYHSLNVNLMLTLC